MANKPLGPTLIKICLAIGFAILIVAIITGLSYAAPLTAEETVQTLKYIETLEAENASLKKQVEIWQSGMNQMSDLAIKVDAQTQVLIARYESSLNTLDRMMDRYEGAILRADTVIDRLERKITNLETRSSIWQLVGLGGVVWGATR